MSDAKQPQEPSMEEILSSIRRIVAEDEEPPGAAGRAHQPGAGSAAPRAGAAGAHAGGDPGSRDAAARPEEAEDDVLELTEVADHEEPQERFPRPGTGWPRLTHAGGEPPNARASEPAGEREKPEAVRQKEALLSAAAAELSASTLARIAQAYQPEEEGQPPRVAGGDRTVEQFLADLLRPVLKEWLDANLPAIVERVVEQEVKKLARRAELR